MSDFRPGHSSIIWLAPYTGCGSNKTCGMSFLRHNVTRPRHKYTQSVISRHFDTWTSYTVILATNFREQKPIEKWQPRVIVQDGSKLLHHQHPPPTKITWQVSTTKWLSDCRQVTTKPPVFCDFPGFQPVAFHYSSRFSTEQMSEIASKWPRLL